MFEDESKNVPLKVQAAIAKYIGGRAEDVALTRSTTEGLALIYHGLPLSAGDEVVVTTHDHYSHHESIRLATNAAGAIDAQDQAVRRCDGRDARQPRANLLAGIGPKTRVVGTDLGAFEHRHAPADPRDREGVEGQASRRAARARRRARHRRGRRNDRHDGRRITSAAGSHKWMFAPRGTGLLWSNAEGWARLRPTVPNFTDWESYNAWAEERGR